MVFEREEVETLLMLVDFEINGLIENTDDPFVDDLKKIKKKLEKAYG